MAGLITVSLLVPLLAAILLYTLKMDGKMARAAALPGPCENGAFSIPHDPQ